MTEPAPPTGRAAAGPADAIDPARPVLFVTTEVPPDRVGAFRALAELIPVEFALFGGGLHATGGVDDHGLPVRKVTQREVHGLAASGRYSAVVAGTVGRTALPAAWLGAERARVPFLLWTALWAHPRSVAHAPGALLLRLLYRRAAAVVTYGDHVSRFAALHGARHTTVAPQAVDQAFWTIDDDTARETARPRRLVYVGRDDPGKGVDWLLRAWDASGLGTPPSPGAAPPAELRLIGPEPRRAAGHAGVVSLGPLAPARVREELSAAAAIVVPSERTATFREPWGLVVNEAMHAGALVIASTEVGAAAGGLVVDGRTGLVVASGDTNGLARALQRAAAPETPQMQGIRRAGQAAARAYTQQAWASAFADQVTRSLAWRA
ncbi:MAG: glycosyltransferase family 4 protein [Solirubrobacteraceae bacterium]|nr:glycosyltransferase family 4 protein [Patulibacter sp.]